MKKLLLTSAGFENPKVGMKFLEIIGKPASEIKVVFIPTAATTEGEKYYVGECKKDLLEVGIDEKNIKVLDLDHQISYSEVAGFDVIYMCGGNTFHLLNTVRKTGFDKAIKQFLEEGKVYTGVSAGSILMGPNIEIAKLGDKNECGVTNFTGLGYIDSAISPHYNEDERKKVEDFKKKTNYPILPLKDNQALLVLDNKTEIIE
ncbi:MAG: peptidase E [Nanoarchaeota archaeon]|nr:peptidase E [Nanoarchaeota archaeon]